MKKLLRWLIALYREAWADGMWVYAPPFVLPGSSPIWRVAPPPRIQVIVAVESEALPEALRTDPQVVAARRAGFRLIMNPSKA